MARVDYFAIQEKIQEVLLADQDLKDAGVTVIVEEDEFLIEMTPWIGIFLNSREKDGESIAGGRRQHFILSVELLCVAHHPESVREAARKRDDLIGMAEIALMGNRNLGGVLRAGAALEIERGDFESARGEAGFVMMGTIELRIITTATI